MRTLIIDDERLARKELMNLLSKHPEIEVIGECANAEEAIKSIEEHSPDLIFLDVQMPGMNGFEMLKKLEVVPQVIFVTAYDEYALRAFKLNSIDYLLKPIHFPDLIIACNKAIETIKSEANSFYLETIYREIKHHNLDLKFNKLAVLNGEEYSFIPFSRINYLEGDGNYTKIFTLDGEKFHTPRTLKTYEEILPKELFYRIHKSHLINLNCIEKYNRNDGNHVFLQNNICLSVSKRKAEDFLRVIQSGGTDTLE
jgi:two-component system LytT family response regulator